MAGAPPHVPEVLAAALPPKLLTLVLIQQGDRVLLGEKKRGFGEGYFNGFGGKVEPGESVEQAARRELLEEACVEACDLQRCGILTFVFDDQPRRWEVHVFRATSFTGEPRETDEMRPVWFAADALPFDRMWADDVYWYPLFLDGSAFCGVFAFVDTHNLVWQALAVCDGRDGVRRAADDMVRTLGAARGLTA